MNSHSAGTSPDPSTFPQRSSSEEFYNAATHFFGLGLSVAGGVALLSTALIGASRPLFLACLIYIASLMAVFLFSALSHSFTDLGRQTFYRKMDQSFIYLLIAASWTPFSVAFLATPWWNGFLLGVDACVGRHVDDSAVTPCGSGRHPDGRRVLHFGSIVSF